MDKKTIERKLKTMERESMALPPGKSRDKMREEYWKLKRHAYKSMRP